MQSTAAPAAATADAATAATAAASFAAAYATAAAYAAASFAAAAAASATDADAAYAASNASGTPRESTHRALAPLADRWIPLPVVLLSRLGYPEAVPFDPSTVPVDDANPRENPRRSSRRKSHR